MTIEKHNHYLINGVHGPECPCYRSNMTVCAFCERLYRNKLYELHGKYICAQCIPGYLNKVPEWREKNES